MTHWTGVEWVATADAWMTARPAAEGIAVTGAPVTYKVRFWAVVRFWFKENNLGQAFEAALVAAMARELPHHVVAPLAIDADRGWMLTPRGGAGRPAVGCRPARLMAGRGGADGAGPE